MYQENPTKVFVWAVLEVLKIDRYNLTLNQERGLEDMVNNYVYSITDPIVEKIEELKKPVDNKILSLEIGEQQEGFTEQDKYELKSLYDVQKVLEKVIDLF